MEYLYANPLNHTQNPSFYFNLNHLNASMSLRDVSFTNLNCLGGGLVATYCNDDYLVVLGTNQPNHVDTLQAIPRPPGYHDASSNPGGNYGSNCVFRTWYPVRVSWAIPLSPIPLSTANASNNLDLFETLGINVNSLPGIGLPTSGSMAVATSGQEIFTIFNNVGVPSHSQCELDKCR